MTVGSLFSGVGGLDLGLERAGFEVRWQVENDDFCLRVLEKHWPTVKRYGDIRGVKGDELEPVDLICGGFPCQDLSQAGKRAGIEGSRSGLWFEFARIVGVLRPRFVLIENVPGLLDRRAMPRVVGELARLGYVGLWRCLRASDFGASHIRKRVFIVAYRNRGDTGSQAVLSEAWRLGRRFKQQGRELAHSPIPRFEGREDSGTDRDNAGEDRGGNSEPERGSESLGHPASDNGRAGISAEKAGTREKRIGRRGPQGRDGTGSAGEDVPDSSQPGLPDPEQAQLSGAQRESEGGTATELCGAFAPGPADPRWPAILAERPDLAPALESPVRGMADGAANWLDRAMSNRAKRLSRIGNAVVPAVAEWIGRRILESRPWPAIAIATEKEVKP